MNITGAGGQRRSASALPDGQNCFCCSTVELHVGVSMLASIRLALVFLKSHFNCKIQPLTGAGELQICSNRQHLEFKDYGCETESLCEILIFFTQEASGDLRAPSELLFCTNLFSTYFSLIHVSFSDLKGGNTAGGETDFTPEVSLLLFDGYLRVSHWSAACTQLTRLTAKNTDYT